MNVRSIGAPSRFYNLWEERRRGRGRKKKITLCTVWLLHSLGSNGMEKKEESFDHDVRQQMERISMIGGDRKSLVPLMDLVADVSGTTHAIHWPVVQKIYILIGHLIK